MIKIFLIIKKERERRYEVVPDKSAVDINAVTIDASTRDMLR
jgi:hypothetical protein